MAKNLALPWYHRQDWSRLQQLFVERDCMPPHYDIWKQRALRAERRYLKKGYEVVRVTVTPQDCNEPVISSIDTTPATRRVPVGGRLRPDEFLDVVLSTKNFVQRVFQDGSFGLVDADEDRAVLPKEWVTRNKSIAH